MDMRLIRYFLAVSEEKNMTKAAEKLNMSQPPLSRQMKQLENEIGLELFIRGGKELKLTESGELLYCRGYEIVKLLEQTKNELDEIKTGEKGNISIAAVQSLGTTWLPSVLKTYNEVHPDVGFNVYIGNSDEIKSRLDSGMYDIGIVREPFDRSSGGYEYIELEKEYWCALMNRNDPLTRKELITVQDLQGEKLLLPMRSGLNNKLRSWLKVNEMKIQVFCNYSELVTAIVLVREGLGVAIVTNAMESLFRKDDTVVMKNIQYTHCITTSAVVWKSNRYLPSVVMQFIQHVKNLIE